MFALKDVLKVVDTNNQVHIYNEKGKYIGKFFPRVALEYLNEKVLSMPVEKVFGDDRYSITVHLEGKENGQV